MNEINGLYIGIGAVMLSVIVLAVVIWLLRKQLTGVWPGAKKIWGKSGLTSKIIGMLLVAFVAIFAVRWLFTNANFSDAMNMSITGVLWFISAGLLFYLAAEFGIFFVTVREGENIVIMQSESANRFIGRNKGYWTDKDTGKIYKIGESQGPKTGQPTDYILVKPEPESGQPVDILGLGIYWAGWWPFAEKYTYPFARNKYIKKEDSTEYDVVQKSDIADSDHFIESYPIVIDDGETKDKLPLKVMLLVAVQTVDLNLALFRNKSPGWLANLTAAVKSAARDFIADTPFDEFNNLKAESKRSKDKSLPDSKGKSEFQIAILLLNDSDVGNPGLPEAIGKVILSMNFISYEMGLLKTDAQKAASTEYFAHRSAEKLKIETKGRADASEDAAREITNLGDANNKVLMDKGLAIAAGAKKLSDDTKDNPRYPETAMAHALENKGGLKTLIVNSPAMPVVNTGEKDET